MRKIVISKEDINDDKFVYQYLPSYIRKLGAISIDYKIVNYLTSIFRFKVDEFIKYSLSNLIVTENENEYFIEINKNIRWNKLNVYSLLSLITYGNRSTKGYPLVDKIFEMVINYLPEIYEEWLENGN